MSMTQDRGNGVEAKGAGTTIATVERAADMLLHMASTREVDFGITELAEDLEMSKAAVHRVLATLRLKGLVDLDPRTRRYALGVGTLRLGLAYLDRIDVRRAGRPAMERLSERTGESTTLSVLLGGQERIYVDQVTPDREVILSVSMGEPYPLYAGASGRVFLAHMEGPALDDYLQESALTRMTGNTVTDRAELRRLVEEAREAGWAVSDGERKGGAAAVAAPVLSHDGSALGVLSVCGPRERLLENLEHCRTELLATSRELSQHFGWHAV